MIALNNEFFNIYILICILLPCIIFQIFRLKTSRENERIRFPSMIWRYILILYLSLVIHITGIGTVWDILSYPELIRSDEISLLPFQSIGLTTYILNIIMFMPLGFLLPLIWEKYRHFKRIIPVGICFSAGIEFLQLFSRRVTDIDDLLMNTLGTLLGFVIWLVFNKLFHGKSMDMKRLGNHEAAVYVLFSLVGPFFLYNWRFFVFLF